MSTINKITTFENNIYNKYNKDILLFFNQLNLDLNYVKSIKSNNIRKKGQLKLLIIELFFMFEVINDYKDFDKDDIYLLYIGAAPGYHILTLIKILNKNYKNIIYELYDPAIFNNNLIEYSLNPNNKINIYNECFLINDNIKKKYFNKKIILISDIRTVDNNSTEPTTENLLNDYKLQNNVIKTLKPLYICVKWRCPFPEDDFKEFKMVNGLELLQPYTPLHSTELRIISKASNDIINPYTFRTITFKDAKNYESKMFYYNINIRKEGYDKKLLEQLKAIIKKKLDVSLVY